MRLPYTVCNPMNGNPEHVKVLRKGASEWNDWRTNLPTIRPDLRGVNLKRVDLSSADFRQADLSGANLSGATLREANFRYTDLLEANLSGANLRLADLSGADLTGSSFCGANLSRAALGEAHLNGADLSKAELVQADLSGAHLSGADLGGADLEGADLRFANLNGANLARAKLYRANLTKGNLSGACLIGADLMSANLNGLDLSGVKLIGANLNSVNLCAANLSYADLSYAALRGTDLSRADLRGADLTGASLINTNLEGANLTGSYVFGISAWGVKLADAIQNNITITPAREAVIQVDRLEIAQFIYLLLNNAEVRHVIDSIASKVVLILGRFTEERKAVLDALRNSLRQHDYIPVLFDFDKPSSRDLTETISTLAHMARFIIADITDAKSIPQELSVIVPHLPSVPVQPLLLTSQHEWGMFEHFRHYPWVLPVVEYESEDQLLNSLEEMIIAPAERKLNEIREKA